VKNTKGGTDKKMGHLEKTTMPYLVVVRKGGIWERQLEPCGQHGTLRPLGAPLNYITLTNGS
jgi:hypothetical protein